MDAQNVPVVIHQHDQISLLCERLKATYGAPGPVQNLAGHPQKCNDISWNSSGDYLASSATDGSVHLWSAVDLKRVGTGYSQHMTSVNELRWSPTDPFMLATTSPDQGILLWDQRKGGVAPVMSISQSYSVDQAGEITFDYSACGNQLGVAFTTSDHRQSQFAIHDIRKQTAITPFVAFSSKISKLCWLRSSNLIALATALGPIHFLQPNFDCDPRTVPSSAPISFSNGHQQNGSSVNVPSYCTPPIHTIQAHTSSIYTLAQSGDRLISGGSDSLVYVWDTNDLSCLQCIFTADNSVRSASVSADGQVIAAAYDREISLNSLHGPKLGSVPAGMWAVAWHPTKPLLALAGEAYHKTAGRFPGTVGVCSFN